MSLTPREVVALASRQTGMPESMLTLDEPLDVEALERLLGDLGTVLEGLAR